MSIPKIPEGEYRFCLILWEHEPINSTKLVKLCQEQLGWKRTTTYTVIKRLEERGILKNSRPVITSLVTKDEVQLAELEEMMEKRFEGSLPAFIAAFTKRQNLNDEEIKEIRLESGRTYRKKVKNNCLRRCSFSFLVIMHPPFKKIVPFCISFVNALTHRCKYTENRYVAKSVCSIPKYVSNSKPSELYCLS